MAHVPTLPGLRPTRRWSLPPLRTPALATAASVALFVAAWQLLTPLLATDLIPTPAEVAAFAWDELRGDTLARTTVWQAFGVSLARLSAGVGVAFAVGVPVGLLMGASRWAEDMLRDLVLVGLAMPFLIWALLAGLWFGMGNAAPVAAAALATAPLIVINTVEGVHDVPRDLVDMARAFELTRRRLLRHVVLPSLLPFFFASLRYGLANGWKAVVVAEIFAAGSGAGWNIQFWYDAHRAQGVIGYAVFFVVFALVVERVVLTRLSRWAFRWRQPAQLLAPGDDATAA